MPVGSIVSIQFAGRKYLRLHPVYSP